MQGKRLFVGNLSHCVAATEEAEQLRKLFSRYGEVEGVNIVKGRRYGFVEMSGRSEAEEAKKELNDYEFNGCQIRVNQVRPPGQRQGYARRGKY